MIWRLVNADPDSIRSHSVVATNQRNHPLPTDLPEALGKRDGELRVLDSGRRALEKAKDLRALAQNFDTVILHIDPADVIPSLAFAGRTAELGPKVMMYNQMDHTFWIGGAISDGVANAREAGARLSVERRGLHPGRMLTLPLIIADTQREQSRDEAKRALGIPPTSTVILTAAVGYKYATTDGPTFFDVVTPVLRQNEDVILLACGPVAEDNWREASRQTDGRIKALGPQTAMRAYHDAADIYLDSFPFNSATSCLDASLGGTPVVSLRPEGRIVLASTTPGLDPNVIEVDTVSTAQAALQQLIDNPELRRTRGDNIRASVRRAHTGAAWFEQLDSALEKMSAMPPAGLYSIQEVPAQETILDRQLLEVHRRGHLVPEVDLMGRGLITEIFRAVDKAS